MAQSFKAEQMKFPRVKAAFAEKEETLKEIFKQKGLAYPPKRIFIRAFKREQILELWTAETDGGEFHLLKEYKICASSGVLGPKRREGDKQVPEGFYFIDVFNPLSNYHLSMRVNYPNQSDRILGAGNSRLGGDIYIHGNCVTIGCIPLSDEGIKELYPLAVEAKAAGQRAIPVHIFPARLSQEGMQRLKRDFSDKDLQDFWTNLIPGFDFFEKHHRLPAITVDKDGRYLIKS